MGFCVVYFLVPSLFSLAFDTYWPIYLVYVMCVICLPCRFSLEGNMRTIVIIWHNVVLVTLFVHLPEFGFFMTIDGHIFTAIYKNLCGFFLYWNVKKFSSRRDIYVIYRAFIHIDIYYIFISIYTYTIHTCIKKSASIYRCSSQKFILFY